MFINFITRWGGLQLRLESYKIALSLSGIQSDVLKIFIKKTSRGF